MAIGNLTQFGNRSVLREIYQPAFEEGVFRNDTLLGLTLPNGQPVLPSIPMTGSAYRFPVNSAGNTSAATFSEGGAAPQPVAQSYLGITYEPVFFWAWTRLSGHVRTAMENGAFSSAANPYDNEFVAGFSDLADLMNTTFMGSTSGIEQIVDDGNTVGGLAQASYTWHQATTTNLNGVLTRTALIDVTEAALDADKGGRTDVILTHPGQVSNYIRLGGAPGASNAGWRMEMSAAGGKGIDVSPSRSDNTFQGAPIFGLPDFSTTDWIGLDLRPAANGPNWFKAVARAFDIRGPQMAGDDDVYELSSAMLVGCHNIRKNWKLEVVTA